MNHDWYAKYDWYAKKDFKSKCILMLVLFIAAILFVLVISYMCSTHNNKILMSANTTNHTLLDSSFLLDRRSYFGWSYLVNGGYVDEVSIDCPSGNVMDERIEGSDFTHVRGRVSSYQLSERIKNELTNGECWLDLIDETDRHAYPIS